MDITKLANWTIQGP